MLHLNAAVTFDSLASKCRDLYQQFKSTAYRTNFDFVDFIQVEKDPVVLAHLEQTLLRAIHARQAGDHLSTAHPDQLEYADCASYQIRGMKRPAVPLADISLGSIYGFLGTKQPVIDQIKDNIRIQGYDADGEACTSWVPFLDFLIFECPYQDYRYILTHRQWYRVEADYLIDLNAKLRAYVHPYAGPALRPWDKTIGEGDYNDLYEQDTDYLVLDRDTFTQAGTRGRGKVEFADLFHLPSKRLIAVKELSGSAALSHLFSQGSVSAIQLMENEEFRQEFLRRVDAEWPGQFARDQIRHLTFVFAVGTSRAGDAIDLLPFFSKVNLLRHAKRITRLGFPVEIVRVHRQ